MGSSAGTYVNGQLVSQQALRENDVIRIGPNRMVFQAGQLRLVSEEGCLRLDAFHLSKVVGKGLRILQDVSLSIKPQEFVAVVGGSGAGKSTLVNALCGFKPATEGAVLLNGVDLYQQLRRLPQRDGLRPPGRHHPRRPHRVTKPLTMPPACACRRTPAARSASSASARSSTNWISRPAPTAPSSS